MYNGYSPTNPAVNPEKITAYEVGAKVRAAGITFTGAAYAYDYKDIQLSSYVTINGTLTVALSNATSPKTNSSSTRKRGPTARTYFWRGKGLLSARVSVVMINPH